MTRMRYTMALCAFFVLGVGLTACGGGVPGDSVADMAGNPITKSAFDHWMYVAAKSQAAQAPGQPVIVPNDPPDFSGCIKQVRKQIPSLAKQPDKQIKSDCSQLFQSLSSQVMDFLIRADWYQAEAAKQHITLSDAQLQKVFQSEKQKQFPTASAFQSFLGQTGQTLPDIMFRVRINQLLRQLLARYTTRITPATIQAYYASHASQFGTPESRDLRIIRTKTAAQANAAKRALQSGQGWKAVAKKYSQDAATKNNGGLTTGVTPGQEEQALDKAAFSAQLNQLRGPIHGTFGYYVFQVTKITPAKKQSLAKATPLIRQVLQSQSQQSAQTALDNAVKKHWQSQTKCRSEFMVADCSGYKPPKAPAATGTTTGSTATATTSSK